MVLIPNTLELTTFWVTPPLAAEVEAHPGARLRDRLSADPVRRAREPRPGAALSRERPRKAVSGSMLVMQNPIRAVVFDLDGLMFDTEALFFRVSSEMLAARGKAFTPEIMRAMIGRRAVDAGHVLKTLAGLDEPVEVLLADVRQRFYARWTRPCIRRRGSSSCSTTCGDRQCRSPWRPRRGGAYAERLLVRHGLRDRFAFVLASEDVSRGQARPGDLSPGGRAIRRAAGSMLVLEDSPAGLAAARGAGAFAVGVPHEHSPAEALCRGRPDRPPARRPRAAGPARNP